MRCVEPLDLSRRPSRGATAPVRHDGSSLPIARRAKPIDPPALPSRRPRSAVSRHLPRSACGRHKLDDGMRRAAEADRCTTRRPAQHRRGADLAGRVATAFAGGAPRRRGGSLGSRRVPLAASIDCVPTRHAGAGRVARSIVPSPRLAASITAEAVSRRISDALRTGRRAAPGARARSAPPGATHLRSAL